MLRLKFILFLLFVNCCLLFVNHCPLPAQDKIVAIVNKDIITQKDLDDFVNFMQIQLAQGYDTGELQDKIESIKKDLLDRLIEDRLILQEAKKSNLTIDENRVKARIDEIKKRYTQDYEFQNALARQGLVQADIEQRIREQLLMYGIIELKVKSKIVVDPKEVTDFYYKNTPNFKIPEQREFESIALEDENLAKELFSKIKGAGDFDEIAQEYSLTVNRFTASQGKELRQDIEAVIFKLSPGEVSRPLKTQGNFYIFKLINIRPPHLQNLSDVQDKVYAFLYEKKMQEELTNWLEELKKNAYIKVFTD